MLNEKMLEQLDEPINSEICVSASLKVDVRLKHVTLNRKTLPT
ncbi:MAG: hypothetical protein C5S49_01310 [Candidatus Methanogaster sp.]|nr:MAG: hypothetical protein C5S49_01310 [ANME-2 cluster archaeon]